MTLCQKLDICHKTDKNLIQRTLEDLVFILQLILIVENPKLKPKKDYDDYTKYVNEEFSSKKYSILCFIFILEML